MFEPNVKGGISEEEFSKLEPTMTQLVEEVARERPAFVKVLFDRNLLDSVEDLREWILNFDNFVVIGIGGSSLGAAALANALKPFDWNYLSKSERGGYLRIFFLENVDPDYTASVLDRIDPRKRQSSTSFPSPVRPQNVWHTTRSFVACSRSVD